MEPDDRQGSSPPDDAWVDRARSEEWRSQDLEDRYQAALRAARMRLGEPRPSEAASEERRPERRRRGGHRGRTLLIATVVAGAVTAAVVYQQRPSGVAGSDKARIASKATAPVSTTTAALPDSTAGGAGPTTLPVTKFQGLVAVTAGSPVSADSGREVFVDDFHDPTSGWGTFTLASGTSFRYSGGGYVVHAYGYLQHYATSPYKQPLMQVAASVTASQAPGAPGEAGFGVACFSGSGDTQLIYQFLTTTDGRWWVGRRRGPSSIGPDTLVQGSTAAPAGPTPETIEGVCATMADGITVRLVMFVDGAKVTDITDSALEPVQGWTTALAVGSGASAPSTVTATRYEVRGLSAETPTSTTTTLEATGSAALQEGTQQALKGCNDFAQLVMAETGSKTGAFDATAQLDSINSELGSAAALNPALKYLWSDAQQVLIDYGTRSDSFAKDAQKVVADCAEVAQAGNSG